MLYLGPFLICFTWTLPAYTCGLTFYFVSLFLFDSSVFLHGLLPAVAWCNYLDLVIFWCLFPLDRLMYLPLFSYILGPLEFLCLLVSLITRVSLDSLANLAGLNILLLLIYLPQPSCSLGALTLGLYLLTLLSTLTDKFTK